MILVFSQYMRALVSGGTCKSATEVGDHAVGFRDRVAGIVIVKSAGKPPGRWAPQEAGLSADSKHIIGEQSCHNIQIEQPQLVIDAVHEVVESTEK